MRFALIFSLALALVVAVFALQNPQSMEVDLFFLETQGSTALVLLITFAIGVVVGLLSSLPGRIRDRRQIKTLKKQLQPSEKPSSSSSPSASSSSIPPKTP